VIDDRVRIRCPRCTKIFSDRAQRVRDGYQVNCEHCSRLLTLNRDSEDPFIRRALKTAREIRAAIEAVPLTSRADATGRSM
jgi:phage FluMu protein Com